MYVPDKFVAEHLRVMKPVLLRGQRRIAWVESLGSRGSDESWAIMQYFLQGEYDKREVIERLQASAARGIDETLEKYKDVWKWEHDAQGNCTWEIVPTGNEVVVP